MSIEDKIEEITQVAMDYAQNSIVSGQPMKVGAKEVTKRIVQVFEDEGWVRIETPSETQKREWEEAHKLFQGDLLTGQEWYERFVNELEAYGSTMYDKSIDTLFYFESSVLKAAKRASGLTNEEEHD